MTPSLILLISSGSKKKESIYTCMSEAKASHLERIWAEVSSSAPHLLHSGLSDSPLRWRCLLRVLCPVRRPVTALDRVLLEDRNLALAPRQGPEINSWACLWVLPSRILEDSEMITWIAGHDNVTACRPLCLLSRTLIIWRCSTILKMMWKLFIEMTKLQVCTVTVEYVRVGTTMTLASRPIPILWATLCLSILQPSTLRNWKYLLDGHFGKFTWAQEMMAQVPKS
jgi:hypothetical protein